MKLTIEFEPDSDFQFEFARDVLQTTGKVLVQQFKAKFAPDKVRMTFDDGQPKDGIFNEKQATVFLNLGKNSLRDMRLRPEISGVAPPKYFKRGRSYFYKKEDLVAWKKDWDRGCREAMNSIDLDLNKTSLHVVK